MKKIRVFWAVCVGLWVSPMAFADAPQSVPNSVKSWSQTMNKPVIWKAGDAYDGRMIQWFEPAFDTSYAEGFAAAIASLNRILETSGDMPLKTCVFSNAVVILRMDQPGCNSHNVVGWTMNE